MERLEYRGYDSCGIISLSNSKLFIKKEAGKIDEIHKKINLADIPNNSKLALAHIRWATHGKPTRINSHPHSDCLNKITVVHNGIIENFLELRDELTSIGHIFKSETDSEVIPHLIEDFMKKGENFKVATINA
ncbi:MAG: class II glutamine amidotransferase [Promethearchaeota archaeon]